MSWKTLGKLAVAVATFAGGCDCGDGSGGDAGARADAGPGIDAGPGSDSGPSGFGPLRVHWPIGQWVTDIALTAGETRQDVFVAEVPTELGVIESATIDFEATLPSISVTRTDSGDTPATAEVSVRMAAGDQMATVCDTGAHQGPVEISTDATLTPVSATPPTLAASDDTLAALNSGMVSVCIETTATASAIVSIEELVLDLLLGIDCAEAPADMDGVWSGTYACESTTCSSEGGPIELTIAQDGHTAAYWDGEAFYVGTVCGDRFAFRGGSAFYEEWGVFTLTGPDTATKTSTYASYDGLCTGDCTDDLSRP